MKVSRGRASRLGLAAVSSVTLLASLLAFLPSPPATAAPPPQPGAGMLDPSFATGGVATVSVSGLNLVQATRLLIQPDGKIVVAGVQPGSLGSVVVARLTSAGALDATFGTGGTFKPGLGSSSSLSVVNLALQPDGKILVVGSSNSSGNPNIAIARLTSNGALDTTFGSGGIAVVSIGGNPDNHGTSVAVTSDGHIVATGTAHQNQGSSTSNWTVLELKSTGALETAFGPNKNGTLTTPLGPNATPNDLVVTGDGHIVAAGFGNVTVNGVMKNVTAVARYNANGSLDTTFNGTGTVTIDTSGSHTNNSASNLVIDGSGRIVVSGTIATSPPTGTVLRLLSSGAVDNTLTGTFGDAGGSNFGATIDGSGRELVAGGSFTGASSTAIGIQRLTTSNTYDSTFGNPSTPGRETIACPASTTGGGTAVGVQTDGKILVGGNCNGSLIVARLLPGAINNLRMSTSTPTAPAGHGTIPLSSIPASLLTLDGTAMATAPTYSSATFGGGTFGGGTFGGGTFGGGTFGGGTFGGGTFGGGTFGGGTFGFVANSPLVSPALPPIPLSEIPLATPASWSSVLAGTAYAGLPPQSVTLQQVLALSPLPASVQQLTIDQFKIFNTALRKVTIASFLLGRTPFANLPAPSGGWCAFFTGQPANCGIANFLTTYGPVDAELLGDNLAGYYSTTPVNLNGLQLVNSVLPSTPLSLIALFYTSLDGVSTSALKAANSAAYPTYVNCTPTTGSDHSCDTLGNAERNGHLVSSTAASFGSFLSTFSGVVGTVTLTSVVPGLIPPQSLPIEKLPLDNITANSPLPATGAAAYQVDFDLACGGAAGLAVAPALPAGFRTIPSSAQMTVGSNPPTTMTVGTDGVLRPPAGFTCSGAPHVTVNFQAEPSSVLGPTTAGVTVSTNSDSKTVSNQAPIQVVDNFEPDTPSAPVPVSSDNLYLGHLPTAGHVDYFGLAAPAPGSIVTVTLSHLPADYDLLVYGPAQPSLRAATFGGGTFGGGTFGGGTFGGGTFGGGTFGGGTFGGGTFGGGTFGGGTFGGGTFGGGNFSSPTVDGSVTPPELLKDVPVLNQPVRSVSIQRGTVDEGVVFPVTESDTTPFLIQISGYNGAASPQPYVLRINVTPPTSGLPCMARNFPGGGTAGTLQTAVSPDTQTLILVNQKRLGDIYGPALVNDTGTPSNPNLGTVMGQLHALAARPDVQGLVIPVEADPTVAGAYNAWDTAPSGPCSVAKANGVVAAINALVDKQRAGLDHLKYVVVVGNDEVIPMGRVPDKTPAFNERGMADSLAANGKDNAESSAFRNGYLLSDDPYGDLAPITSLEGQVFVPQLAVGRLVETPSEIINAISQYATSNGVRNTNTGFVTGYDALAASASAVANTLAGRLPTTSLINSTWTRQDVTTALGSAYHGLIDINAHSNPVAALPAQEFFNGTSSNPITTADLPADLSGSILLTIGCHVGLDVPDVFVSGGVPDWPQVTSRNGGTLQANTGYGLFDTNSVAFSDRILGYFAQNLDGTMSVGQALMFAKQKYLNMGVASPYDAKALQEAAYYGLPMYRVNLNGKVGTTAPPVVIPSAPPPQTTPALASSPVSFNTPLTQVNAAHGGGSYFVVGNEYPEVAPNEPIEPRTEIPLPARNDQLFPHGVLIESMSSADIPGFTPVYGNVTADNVPPPSGVSSASFPSNLAAVGGTLTPSGPQTSVVLVPGQFSAASGGNGTGTQRNYSNLQGSVYYSNSTDLTPPNISSVAGTVQNTTATFLVTTPDTNIVRVVVQALIQGGTGVQAWQKVELANLGNGSWGGTLTVPAGTPQITTFGVQMLNALGNVSVSFNKGPGFTALQGPPLFTSSAPPQITITTPKNGGVYPGAPGSPVVASQFNCASPVGIRSCTGPATVDTSSPGTHTFTVTATDNQGVTQTASTTYTVDSTAPSVTLSQPFGPPVGGQPPSTNQTTASFTFSAADTDDAGSTLAVACIVDGGTTYSCTSPQNLVNLPPGQHTFTVLASDGSGNVGSTTYTWNIDNTAPVVTFTQTPPALTNTSSATFAWTGSDSDNPTSSLTFKCSLDSAAPAACSSPQSFTASNGNHSYTVQASDPAGNTGSASFQWRVDTTAPVFTSPVTGPANPTNQTSATFSYAANDPDDATLTYTCSLVKSGSPTPIPLNSCTGTGASVSGPLSDGTYTFMVTAADPAGNQTTASLQWVIETTPPTVNFTQTPTDPTLQTTASAPSATFAFSVTDPDNAPSALSVTCSLDGATVTPCTPSGTTVNGLTPQAQPHVFTVTAVDPAGNRASASFSWHVYYATNVTANGVVRNIPTLTATLNRVDTGAALPGQVLAFTIGQTAPGHPGQPVNCNGTGQDTATTDPNGVATCNISAGDLSAVVLSGGFTASFATTGSYYQSQGSAGVIG